MPLYKFECDGCGDQQMYQWTFAEHDEYRDIFRPHVIGVRVGNRFGDRQCGVYRQVLDFHFNRGMSEHYSDQLDTVVTSERHFNDELKRQQDEYTARTGLEARFETLDPTDPKAAGVTDAGLESQERASHAATNDGHKTTFVVNQS